MTEEEAKVLIDAQLDNSTGNYVYDSCSGAVADCGGVSCSVCPLRKGLQLEYLPEHYPHLAPELRSGDIIRTEVGRWYQVLHPDLWQGLYIKQSGNMLQVTVTSMYRTDEIKHIIKGMIEVYRDLKGGCCFEQMVNDGKFKVWEHPIYTAREVTVAELEKELGYKIKIIEEK